MASSLPRLVVFDLDYTLWPFWVDTHVVPPFKKVGDRIVDFNGAEIHCYPEVPQVFESLKADGILVGIASSFSLCRLFAAILHLGALPSFQSSETGLQLNNNGQVKAKNDDYRNRQDMLCVHLELLYRTHCVNAAKQLVELFDWNKYIAFSEIYPGKKVTHFNRFHEESGIDFQDMVFFDDEYRNIIDIKALGVTCIFVNHGVSLSVLHEGLRQFSSAKRKP